MCVRVCGVHPPTHIHTYTWSANTSTRKKETYVVVWCGVVVWWCIVVEKENVYVFFKRKIKICEKAPWNEVNEELYVVKGNV